MGNILDPEGEQDNADSEDIGLLEHPEYNILNPDGIINNESTAANKAYRQIVQENLEKLIARTRELDEDQRTVLDIFIKYSKEIKKFLSRKGPKPKPPLVKVQGEAGSGKSTLIYLIEQWMERILRKSGDDPNQPYIIKATFTGAAACIISGQTLHSAFGFKFSNEKISLTDKDRDMKRTLLRNLQLVIIDEMSMIKSDMLYQLDFRLKEIMQNVNKDLVV